MHTLLFTDVVDSTRLVERLGDAAAAALWAEHDRRARLLLAHHRGREIDRSDGFFLLFDAALNAACFAIEYHQALAALALRARVGIHVAAVTLRQNPPQAVAQGAKPVEVEGLAKPFAARIMSLAGGGQTLLSASAHAALGANLSAGAALQSHGHYRLQGIEAPIEIFELGAAGCTFGPPPDTDKVYRVVPVGSLWQPRRQIRHNLAPERDTFIGRGTELRALARRLEGGARQVTVLGSGGTGKTRFVRRYALSWLGDWPGGVYFCDLSEARSLDGLQFAVALALGVPLGKDDPVVQLGHAIAGRGRCLVILDNFEQVVEHAPATLGRWLDQAADAAFVVTSRERLQLQGEGIFPIGPLALDSEAIELFATRARAQQPGFELGDANRAAVAEVVRLLDGLPLAVELAAARTRIFSAHQLVERMKDRFRLLAGAPGTGARQATLRAAIDWSWDLLAPWEQAALTQCAVFEGGFTMEAAEAVLDLSAWPDAPPAMDAIQALVDKSLLRSWVPVDQGRFDIEEPFFGMFLSIHDYAMEQLEAGGLAPRRAGELRHARFFAGFGSDAAIEALSLQDGGKRRHRLALDLDNLVAACQRSLAVGSADLAIATYRAVWEVLELQGSAGLGATLGPQVLGMVGLTPSQRAAASLTRGRASSRAGNAAEALVWFEGALGLAQSMQDQPLQGAALGHIGSEYRQLGRMDEARACLEAAVAIHHAAGQTSAAGTALGDLALVHYLQGHTERARASLEDAVAIHRQVGNRRNEGIVLGHLALVDAGQGRIDEARARYEAALAVHRELGDHRFEGIVLGNMGNLHRDSGQTAPARACFDAALLIHREMGNRRQEGTVRGNLGSLQRDLGQHAQARLNCEIALSIAREVGNGRNEGFILATLGDLHLDEDRLQEALACCEQALVVSRASGDVHTEVFALGRRAKVLVRLGRGAAAREDLHAAEAVLRDLGDRLELAKLLCIRARLDASDDPEAARAALAEAELTALAVNAGPESELGRAIAQLRAAPP